jgi:hypothetical protein
MATTMKELGEELKATIATNEARIVELIALAKSQLASPKGSPEYRSWGRTRNELALVRSKVEIQNALLASWQRDYDELEAERSANVG